MSTIAQPTDNVPDFTAGLCDISGWFATLARNLDRFPPAQRRELLRITRDLRGDLAAINLPVPNGSGR